MQNLPTLGGAMGLTAVVGRFQSWRKTHAKRSRLPDKLWADAAELARTHGVHRVAQTLNLAYYDLKRRVEVLRPTFVEVQAVPPPATPAFSFVELERSDGARMKVQCASQGDLVALADSFWRCRA